MKRLIWLLTFLTLAGYLISKLWGNGNKSLTEGLRPLITTTSLKAVLTFSVIGDPENDLENLKKALTSSKNAGDKFTVLVGDLTATGSLKEFKAVKKVLEESELDYYVLPGNHDLYSAGKLAAASDEYFKEVFGNSYQSVILPLKEGEEIGKLQLLLLNNADEKEGMEKEQFNLVKELLGSKLADLSIIFLHKPVFHPSSDYIMGYQSELITKQREELLMTFKKASVSAVFSGHLHNMSSYENDGLKMFVAGSVNSSRNWQTPRYLEVKVYENKTLIVGEVEL